ncbi:dual specificity phosphatase [Cladorrhinum samala]|uniref:protein-tyrosine-phosphatase n=1 Tax=Cladorrhinum samala TaxID=585594 RepID=A0AAV9HD12_9PEZI|nr:dual specificity phosphatase [Cladorrhinum samala]
MPSATSRRLYEDQIPSFMSVYGLENGLDHSTVTIVDPNLVMEESKLPGNSQPGFRTGALPSEPVHQRNDSTSAAESADSSPTTTVSCTDSSDLSDPSPSSSPDSPVNSVPLRTFAPTPFGGLSGMASLSLSSPALERPMTSPAPRRPKNMKGLSIQPPFGGSLSSTEASEPSSPVFIKPKIPAMKRKPSQLSLKTSTSDLIMRTTQEVPSSPTVAPILQRRALKHSTSSPHMLSGLKSATFGPAGGMTIPTVLERNETGLSSFLRPPKPPVAPGLGSAIAEEDSPIRTQVANRAAYEIEPFHEVEGDEDQKSPGYPDGPIAIYGDNVYLYLEPTAEEASKFDVVINVAREVNNPFKIGKTQPSQEDQKPADDSPIPDTAVTTASFATAFEYFPDVDTPTTPKAPFREPEYIHMPWDHNTDISPELMSLCETIEKKTKEGKKVLVHCQQGASRSASLIIAYGLYQNPELSVNDAYHNAQAKSRWISPNMRLMYCLQDFQKEVSKRRLSPNSGLKLRSGRSPTHRAAMSVDQIDLPHKEPLTAPLPVEDPVSSGKHSERSPVRGRGTATSNLSEPISPGPSSAPSSFSWTEKEDESDPGKYGRFNLDSLLMPSHPDSGFASSVSSLSKPPPSPGFPPASITVTRAPPSPGLGGFTLSMPPKSPGFASSSFASMSSALSRPPPSPGLAPIELSRPPMSPGFPPSDPFAKPPPSPGFAAHRFGSSESFGFAPLHFAPPQKPVAQKSLSPEGTFGFSHLSANPQAPNREEARPPSSQGGFGFTPLSLALPPRPVQNEAPPERTVTVKRSFCDDGSLMSPRVEVMTNNPIHQGFPGLSAGVQLVEVPPTPPDALFSPRETMFPRDPFYPFGRPQQNEDPRSPPTLGETPIVRSIDEMI